MRHESKAERAAWTAFIDGDADVGVTKYHSERQGKYASKHEADVATKLWALQSRGCIRDLREQERVILVEGQGKMRSIVWVADFTYLDALNHKHYLDAKGFRTPVYRLKKRLAALLLGLEIEEV